MHLTVSDGVILLVLVSLAVAALSRRLTTPAPVVLAIAGLALGIAWRLLPLPAIEFPPHLVLLIFLPPLLLRASYSMPLGAFRANLRAILLLAVGLVLATMAVSAFAAHVAMPALPWIAALTLGAIIAPPDPVAATAMAERTGLSSRLVTILEGEGLVNDAVAIVAYRLAVEAAVIGGVTVPDMLVAFLRQATEGVAIGVALGWLSAQARRRLDDEPLETAISVLTPFVTYELAERLGGSAVLAVVALGFVLRRYDVHISGPSTRLTTRTVWRALDFVGTTLVFMLIGIQIGAATGGSVTADIVRTGAIVSAGVVGVRLVWMLVVPRVVRLLGAEGRKGGPAPSWQELTVLGWAGMRGVVSLALALALPFTTASGAPFPGRPQIILLSFVVILATLMLQGLTLVPLTRLLGVGDPGAEAREEQQVRQRALHAAHAAVARASAAGQLPEAECRRIADVFESGDLGIAPGGAVESRGVIEEAISVQRTVVAHFRDLGRIGDPLALRLEAELDRDLVRLRDHANSAALPAGDTNAE